MFEWLYAITKEKMTHRFGGVISIDQDEGLGMRLETTQFAVQHLRNLLERLTVKGRKALFAPLGRFGGRNMTWAAPPTQVQGATLILVVVGLKEASLHKIQDFVQDEGGEILVLDSTALTTFYPIARANPDHVIIDLDAAGGITAAYPALRGFRDRHPDIPVILLSDEFSTDDFGTDRLALCDVSLRIPFSFATFSFALREAEVNNAVWQQRQIELSQIICHKT